MTDSKQAYTNYLTSIIQRSSDALYHLGGNNLSEFWWAINTVDDDLRCLLEIANNDEAIADALIAEEK